MVFSSENIGIDILDARLLGEGGRSLAKIGETLGYPNGDFDFEKLAKPRSALQQYCSSLSLLL